MSSDERPQDRPTGQYGGYPHQSSHPQQGQPQYGYQGHSQQHGYPLQPGYPDQPAYGVLRDNSNGTLALVLGLIGLCTGLLIVSPIAWWKGSQALAEINAAPGVYNNRGMALGGQICGIIGTVLLALVVLFFGGLLIFLVALS